MFHRYLLNMSYIGTYFRGAQKQWSLIPSEEDTKSIEGNIEIALKKLRYKSASGIIFSSRTDAGVHAFNNTAHVDLVTKSGEPINCHRITRVLNTHFERNDLSILVKETRKVPETFHARFSALSRTYLYRIAVHKNNLDDNHGQVLPIEEWKRIYLIRDSSFDIEKFKEAAVLFEGLHDFGSFRKADKSKQWTNNLRRIYSMKISRGSTITSHNDTIDEFDFYNIKIKGKSFVHNQIRRMIGILEAVSVGKINTRDVQIMLQVPSKYSWISSASVAPAHGLYLCDVEYDPQHLIINA